MFVTLSFEARSFERPRELALSAEGTGAYCRRIPEVEGGIRRHSCRAVCLCVRVQPRVFPVWEKRVAIVKIALSVVSVIACHSDKACSGRMCGVGRTSSL